MRPSMPAININALFIGQGRAVVVVVHGSPKAPIVGDDCGEGGRRGSVADETITDGAKTTATTKQTCTIAQQYKT